MFDYSLIGREVNFTREQMLLTFGIFDLTGFANIFDGFVVLFFGDEVFMTLLIFLK